MFLIRKLLSPYGRLSRGGMWLWGVAVPLLVDLMIIMLELIRQENVQPTMFTYSSLREKFYLIYMWPTIVLSIKRFHDLGLSGWLYIILSSIQLTSFALYFGPLFLGSGNISGFIDIPLSIAKSIPAWGVYITIGVALVTSVALFWLTLISPGQLHDNKYGTYLLDV